MPENEKTNVGHDQAAKAKEIIRTGFRLVSDIVHSRQAVMGYWPEQEGDLADYRIFFAELHSKVANAYETYKEERDPTHLIWIDPATGEEVAPGNGIPQGLATDLIDIIFDVLGFATNVGIDVGGLAAEVVIAMKSPPVATEDEETAEQVGAVVADAVLTADEEEDFDLEAILANVVQAPPQSVEIETPPSDDKKPEDGSAGT